MSYTPEKADPRSRARYLIGDTDDTAPMFTDDEWDLALKMTAEEDFLWIYLDDTDLANAAVTAATVQVQVGSDHDMVLSRTVSGTPTPVTLPLATDLRYDQIWELLNAIRDLGLGWKAYLSLGRRLEPVATQSNAFPSDFAAESAERAALERKSWDLAPTGALDVYGSTKKKRLRIYNVRAAALEALRTKLRSLNEVDSYSEGDISWTRGDIEKRIRDLQGFRVVGAMLM